MKEIDIQKILGRNLFNYTRNLVIPNCCTMTCGEADLLVVRPSGWCEEVEVKVTKSDFRSEFKNKTYKHRQIQMARHGQYEQYCSMISRRFWFAMPLELASELLPDIPEYAGLIGVELVDPWWRSKHFIIKKAPLLSGGQKVSMKQLHQASKNICEKYWRTK